MSRREKGIRVYQVPEDSNEPIKAPEKRYRQLALTTARVFGPTTKRFLISELRHQNHLLPTRGDRWSAVESLVESGELAEVEVAGVTYLWTRNDWLSAEVPERVRFLAPFDPLVRDRDRFVQLWEWNYRFEAYVPEAKRERGYYAMPVLWCDKIIGWANAKVQDQCLKIQFGYAEKKPRVKAFRLLAEEEADSMARFLGLRGGAWELTY